LVLLESGCICCSINGELAPALKRLFEQSGRGEIPRISRVIIETTGLADPVPVVGRLMEDDFVAARYICDGVVTVADATHASTQLLEHAEARSQVIAADRLLVTKCDVASSFVRLEVVQLLRTLNPVCEIVELLGRDLDLTILSCGAVYSASPGSPNWDRWMRATGSSSNEPQVFIEKRGGRPFTLKRLSSLHDGRTSSFVVSFERAAAWYGFCAAMVRVLQLHGTSLLRVKGLMNIAGASCPVVVHCVRETAYPVISLDRWPTTETFADHRGRLVFILRDDANEMIQESIRSLLRALPSDLVASRLLAETPSMATRCWFRQPVAGMAPDIEHDGWVIQRKRFSRAGRNS
ncbi:MAG: CobW family GTP-binding protein, partial [Gammaproteobacteria bacterium]